MLFPENIDTLICRAKWHFAIFSLYHSFLETNATDFRFVVSTNFGTSCTPYSLVNKFVGCAKDVGKACVFSRTNPLLIWTKETVMKTELFFGPQADDILSAYRRIHHLRESSEALESRLAKLKANRDAEGEEHGDEIAQHESAIDEYNRKLDVLSKDRRNLIQRRDKLSDALKNPFHLIWVIIKHAIIRSSISLEQERAECAALSEKIELLEKDIVTEDTSLQRLKTNLRKLKAPIESLNFAIDYLNDRKQSAEEELLRLNDYIDSAIQSTVKLTPLQMLQKKSQQLAQYCDDEGLPIAMLELKKKLHKLNFLEPRHKSEASPMDIASTLNNVGGAVREGFRTESGSGRGRVEVSGSGTKHVKKTRTVSDGSGRSRTQTYWKNVRVDLSGAVDATFNVEYARWNRDSISLALEDEAFNWLTFGKNQHQKDATNEVIAHLSEDIASITKSLRVMLDYPPTSYTFLRTESV